VHPKLIVAIVKDRRRSRPHGAVAGQLHRLCHKRLARMTWRRPISQRSRDLIRRQANQRVRASAWTLAAATPMLGITGKGGRS
jgi:hypothetical protein